MSSEEATPNGPDAMIGVGSSFRSTPKWLKKFNPRTDARRHSYRPVGKGKLVLLAECVGIPAPIAPKHRTIPEPRVPLVETTQENDYVVVESDGQTSAALSD